MRLFKRSRYYLVSYAHESDFGNIFIKARPRLDIKAAERTAEKTAGSKAIVLGITQIHKSQFVGKD